MNKKLITIGIILVFLMVGLSGCNEKSSTNQDNFQEPINYPPTVACWGIPWNGTAPLIVEFYCNSQDNDIVQYEWDFHDDSSLGFQNPITHTFVNSGNYFITLTVTDNKGAKGYCTCEVTVF